MATTAIARGATESCSLSTEELFLQGLISFQLHLYADRYWSVRETIKLDYVIMQRNPGKHC